MLNHHMQMAAGGIRFAGSTHEELFTVKDGGRVIARPKDTTLVAANLYCRYVDEDSVDIGIGVGYPIAQLVDDLLRAGYTLSPAEKED